MFHFRVFFYLNQLSVITIASTVTFCEQFQLLTVSKLVSSFSSSSTGGLQLVSAASRNICGQLLMLTVGSSVAYFVKWQSHSKISCVSTSILLWTFQSTLHSHANSVECRTIRAVVPLSPKQRGPHSTIGRPWLPSSWVSSPFASSLFHCVALAPSISMLFLDHVSYSSSVNFWLIIYCPIWLLLLTLICSLFS